MLGYYLGSIGQVAEKAQVSRVLDIGAGYGATIRIGKLHHPDARFTILDLPETLILSYVFLGLCFPECKLAFVNSEAEYQEALKDADFIFVPVQHYRVLEGSSFDLAINTGSIQEVPAKTARAMYSLLQDRMEVSYFYSFNYFANARQVLAEWQEADKGEERLNICPVLDEFWQTDMLKLNPDNLTVDCKGRNWLELLLCRRDSVERDPEALPAAAAGLFIQSFGHTVMSDDWLKCLWSAVWMDPRPEYVSALLVALEAFFVGNLRPNNVFSGVYGSPANPDTPTDERKRLFELSEETHYFRESIMQGIGISS